MWRRPVALAFVVVSVASGCGKDGAATKSGGSAEDAVREAFIGYQDASTSSDPKDVCALLADVILQRAVGATGEQGVKRCEKRFAEAGGPLQDPTALKDVRIVKVTVSGARATVEARFTNHDQALRQTTRLVRERGRWRVASTGKARAASDEREAYRVPSESMLPNYKIGEVVLADQHAYDDARPEYGDVILFHPPAGAETATCGHPVKRGSLCARPSRKLGSVTFIKRIVGLPGDRISFHDGRVIRNGKPDRFNVTRCDAGGGCNYPKAIKVIPGHYYVAGDNRGSSDDSRFWGPVPARGILGRVK